MAGDDYTRQRRKQAPATETAIQRSFEMVSRALAVRPTSGAVRYLVRPAEADSASPRRLCERVITGNSAAPNTTAPAPAATLPTTDQAECVFFADHGAGQSFGVEAWAESDVHADPDDTESARLWVLVQRFAAIEPFVEYRCPTGHRRLFLRVVDSEGVAADAAFVLRATAV
jgi:hypothetical protein